MGGAPVDEGQAVAAVRCADGVLFVVHDGDAFEAAPDEDGEAEAGGEDDGGGPGPVGGRAEAEQEEGGKGERVHADADPHEGEDDAVERAGVIHVRAHAAGGLEDDQRVFQDHGDTDDPADEVDGLRRGVQLAHHKADGEQENGDGDLEFEGLDPGIQAEDFAAVERQGEQGREEEAQLPPEGELDAAVQGSELLDEVHDLAMTIST